MREPGREALASRRGLDRRVSRTGRSKGGGAAARQDIRHSDERTRQWSTARRLVSMVEDMATRVGTGAPPADNRRLTMSRRSSTMLDITVAAGQGGQHLLLARRAGRAGDLAAGARRAPAWSASAGSPSRRTRSRWCSASTSMCATPGPARRPPPAPPGRAAGRAERRGELEQRGPLAQLASAVAAAPVRLARPRASASTPRIRWVPRNRPSVRGPVEAEPEGSDDRATTTQAPVLTRNNDAGSAFLERTRRHNACRSSGRCPRSRHRSSAVGCTARRGTRATGAAAPDGVSTADRRWPDRPLPASAARRTGGRNSTEAPGCDQDLPGPRCRRAGRRRAPSRPRAPRRAGSPGAARRPARRPRRGSAGRRRSGQSPATPAAARAAAQ